MIRRIASWFCVLKKPKFEPDYKLVNLVQTCELSEELRNRQKANRRALIICEEKQNGNLAVSLTGTLEEMNKMTQAIRVTIIEELAKNG